MIRRLIALGASAAVALLGCNALLGIDDGTFLDLDAGSAQADAASDAPGLDGSKPREPLEVTMRKSALRVPRAARSTMTFDVGGFDSPSASVEIDVATPLPPGFVLEGAHGEATIATVTLSASTDAATPPATIAVTFRRGSSTKVLDLQLLTGPSGTPDITFGSGGILELNTQGESDTPILAAETRGDLMTVESSGKPVVGRYDDTGRPRAIFDNRAVALDTCEPRSLLSQDDAVLVFANCGATARLYEVDALGKVTLRAVQPGSALGLAAMKAGVRIAVLTSGQQGEIELRAADGGLVGKYGSGTEIDAVTVAVAASGERFIFGVPLDGTSGTSFALHGSDAGRDLAWGTSGAAPLPGFGTDTESAEAFDSVTATAATGGGALFAGVKSGDTTVSVATHLSPSGGSLPFALTDAADAISAVAQDAAGRFVVARHDIDFEGGSYLQRYSTAGNLDTSFGVGGRADLLVPDFTPNTIAFDSDGLILVGGYADADGIMRFWP